MDGPPDLHDLYRRTRDNGPTYEYVLKGYRLLQRYGVPTDILCVVNNRNSMAPLEVYSHFKEIGAEYITFIPLVEHHGGVVDEISVTPDSWGSFLCRVFDEWVGNDVGKIRVQIFEEAIRAALGQDHLLCVFKPVCGMVPVVEHNGDYYTCDHFVDRNHCLGNIAETPLKKLLGCDEQLGFGLDKAKLPDLCRDCSVLGMCNGGCMKNRFVEASGGLLNYLCRGYREFFTHIEPFSRQVARLMDRSGF